MKTILSFPDCGTDIPYFDPEQFTPDERHEYVDLRANPAGVDALPELNKAAQFKEFLLEINGADTIFSSFGCNFDLVSAEVEVVGPPIAPSEEPQTQTVPAVAHSYIHVGFADIGRCTSLDDYYRLVGRLFNHLHKFPEFADRDGVEFHTLEIGIETLHMNGDWKGFICAFNCDTLGWTDNDAMDHWAALMKAISSFLANERLE